MDYSTERLRSALQHGQNLTTAFEATCPSDQDVDSILAALNLARCGTLFLGVAPDQPDTFLDGPAVPRALAALRESSARLQIYPAPSIDAVRLGAGWVAYCAVVEDPQWESCFDELTAPQARLLLALIRESVRGRYRPTVVAVGGFEGWSLLFASAEGSGGAEVKGDFDETDLHALRDGGYITLLVKRGQHDLSLKPRALRRYREALQRRTRHAAGASPGAATLLLQRDVFICHAGPDKSAIVGPLVTALEVAGVTVWYDASQICWGDSLIAKVNEGLRASRYVIVVLSPSFPGRPWPERELNAALSLEAQSGECHVLALLAGTPDEIATTLQRYPLLGDKRYLAWTGDPSSVVGELRRVLNRA